MFAKNLKFMTTYIRYGGCKLRLTGNYQRGVDSFISDNDNSTPGYGSSYEIETVELVEGDLFGLILHIENKSVVADLEELAIESIE